MFLAITAIVSRARPDVPRLDTAPPTSSFPSGHTFAAVVLWGALAIVAYRSHWSTWWRRLFLVLVVVLPLLVGFSRVYRGMHHLTDVLASFVLGAMWLGGAGAPLPDADRRRPMSTAQLVPETWELDGDDAAQTLRRARFRRLLVDSITPLPRRRRHEPCPFAGVRDGAHGDPRHHRGRRPRERSRVPAPCATRWSRLPHRHQPGPDAARSSPRRSARARRAPSNTARSR